MHLQFLFVGIFDPVTVQFGGSMTNSIFPCGKSFNREWDLALSIIIANFSPGYFTFKYSDKSNMIAVKIGLTMKALFRLRYNLKMLPGTEML